MARLTHYRKDPQSVTSCGDHFTSTVGVSVWSDVTCPDCLQFRPFKTLPKFKIGDRVTALFHGAGAHIQTITKILGPVGDEAVHRYELEAGGLYLETSLTLVPSGGASLIIDDAMVDRALDAYYGKINDCSITFNEAMRAALKAALGQDH